MKKDKKKEKKEAKKIVESKASESKVSVSEIPKTESPDTPEPEAVAAAPVTMPETATDALLPEPETVVDASAPEPETVVHAPAHAPEENAAADRLRKLEAELEQLKQEVRKIKNQSNGTKKWFFKELLKSPVLGEITNLYIEHEGKENLYDEIKAYMASHARETEKIETELIADKEQYRGDNLCGLAAATGILSVTGIVFAASGAGAEMGVLILLFAVLIAVSVGVWMLSARNTQCSRMIEYILTTCKMLEKSGNSKNL